LPPLCHFAVNFIDVGFGFDPVQFYVHRSF
jgi:hypothetical protein